MAVAVQRSRRRNKTTLPLHQKGNRSRRRKIKCFRCGEMGHYATQCPLKRKDKEEKEYPQAEAVKIEAKKDCAMFAHIPKGEKWADLDL